MQTPQTNPNKHLWDYQPVRDALWCLLLVLAALALYSARAVTLPVLLSLAAAYAVNPLVTWCNRRFKVRRWIGSTAILATGLLAFTALTIYVVPKLLRQLVGLAQKLPQYVTYAADQLKIDWHNLANQAEHALAPSDPTAPASQLSTLTSNFDIRSAAEFFARSLGVGIDLVGSAIGWVSYLAVAAVVFSFCFICFSAEFAAILAWFGDFIPTNRRESAHHILGRMDRAVSAFLRGRLIQACVMSTILTLGWWAVGVPYWLLLGLIAGFLSFVPYAASIGWIIAIAVTWADRVTGGTGFSVWAVLLWPTVVYAVAQLLDGWVVEPTVQGKATDLDPVSVLLAVLIGGSLAGLIGLVLAIPAAACGKILAQEWLLPKFRRTAKITAEAHSP